MSAHGRTDAVGGESARGRDATDWAARHGRTGTDVPLNDERDEGER